MPAPLQERMKYLHLFIVQEVGVYIQEHFYLLLVVPCMVGSRTTCGNLRAATTRVLNSSPMTSLQRPGIVLAPVFARVRCFSGHAKSFKNKPGTKHARRRRHSSTVVGELVSADRNEAGTWETSPHVAERAPCKELVVAASDQTVLILQPSTRASGWLCTVR